MSISSRRTNFGYVSCHLCMSPHIDGVFVLTPLFGFVRSNPMSLAHCGLPENGATMASTLLLSEALLVRLRLRLQCRSDVP